MSLSRILVISNEPVLPADHPDAAQEHDVVEATEIVVGILRDAGFAVRQLSFAYDPRPLLDELREHQADVVFNMFEGLATQTATEISVVSLLEWLRIPFTGAPSFAIALGRDKIRTKYLLRGAGVPTAEFAVVDKLPVPVWKHAWPAIVKPALQDCSVGIEQASVVTNQKDLEARIEHVLGQYGPPVLVEEFIAGRELHANVFEDLDSHRLVCIPLAEIHFAYEPGEQYWPIYSYDAKWNVETHEFNRTPLSTAVDVAPALLAQIEEMAGQAYRLIGLRDFGRIDFRVSPSGQPYVLEVNPNPYLHSESIVDGLKSLGRSHPQMIADMARAAFARGGSS